MNKNHQFKEHLVFLALAFLLLNQPANARYKAPQIDCELHQSSVDGLREGLDGIYNVHFYRDPQGIDTQEIIDRTGKYSALGHAEVKKSNGKIYGSSATLFHNCLAVVSRHAFEVDPVVGKSNIALFFGPPKGSKAFSFEVTGTVIEVPKRPNIELSSGDTRSTATDLAVVEIKDKNECASLSTLTPAVPVPVTADVFLKFNSGNSGDYELLTTRQPNENDSSAIKTSQDLKKTRKSIRETCGVNNFYAETHADVPRGTVIFHNCSSVPGSSGGAIVVKTTDPVLYVGAINKGDRFDFEIFGSKERLLRNMSKISML